MKQAHHILAKVGHVLGDEVAEMTEVILSVEDHILGELTKSPACVLDRGQVVLRASYQSEGHIADLPEVDPRWHRLPIYDFVFCRSIVIALEPVGMGLLSEVCSLLHTAA